MKAVLLAIVAVALTTARLVSCLCHPEVLIHLGLATCYAVNDDLLHLPQMKHAVPVSIVALYCMLAGLHVVANWLKSGSQRRTRGDEGKGDYQP